MRGVEHHNFPTTRRLADISELLNEQAILDLQAGQHGARRNEPCFCDVMPDAEIQGQRNNTGPRNPEDAICGSKQGQALARNEGDFAPLDEASG